MIDCTTDELLDAVARVVGTTVDAFEAANENRGVKTSNMKQERALRALLKLIGVEPTKENMRRIDGTF